MAEALAATGASLVLFDLNHAQARGLASDLKAKHSIRAEAVEGSVTNSDDVARGCRTAIELTGRLDIVMNNAGIVGNAPSSTRQEYSTMSAYPILPSQKLNGTARRRNQRGNALRLYGIRAPDGSH
jgi:NAD(P)-dependent dehydrogenase (short-subunit alcohol dehydrogenase family)